MTRVVHTRRRIDRAATVLLALATASAVSACGSDESAETLRFGDLVAVELPLPDGASAAGVASIVWSGQEWAAGGSFRDEGGEHRPGLWTSPDGLEWQRIETSPVTYYGEVSELYSVATSDRGLVALGSATGGAHGNPRTVSWVLADDGVLHEVVASFELYNGIRQISVRSVIDGPDGWVIIGSRVNQNDLIGPASWTSATGDDFVIHDDDPTLASTPEQQAFGLDATTIDGSLVAVGAITTWATRETDGIGWASADGATWSAWTPDGLDLDGDGAQRPQRIDASGTHVVIAGSESFDKATSIVAWTTTDGDTWRRATIDVLGASDDVLSAATEVVAMDDGFAVAARSGGRLGLAVSADGESWQSVPLADGLPSGNRATLTVAAHDDVMLVGATSLEGGGLWLVSGDR